MFTIIREILRAGKFALSYFGRDERGVTTIEYGILAAGLALIIGILVKDNGPFHNALTEIFNHVLETLPESDSSGNTQN